MKVDGNKTRDAFQDEVEFQEDSLNSSCLVLTGGFDRAGEVDV